MGDRVALGVPVRVSSLVLVLSHLFGMRTRPPCPSSRQGFATAGVVSPANDAPCRQVRKEEVR